MAKCNIKNMTFKQTNAVQTDTIIRQFHHEYDQRMFHGFIIYYPQY